MSEHHPDDMVTISSRGKRSFTTPILHPHITRSNLDERVEIERSDFDAFINGKMQYRQLKKHFKDQQHVPELEKMLDKINLFSLPRSWNPYQHGLMVSRDILHGRSSNKYCKSPVQKTLEIDRKKHEDWEWRTKWSEWDITSDRKDAERVSQIRENERHMWVSNNEKISRFQKAAASLGENHSALTAEKDLSKQFNNITRSNYHTRSSVHVHQRFDPSMFRMSLDVPSEITVNLPVTEIEAFAFRDSAMLRELARLEKRKNNSIRENDMSVFSKQRVRRPLPPQNVTTKKTHTAGKRERNTKVRYTTPILSTSSGSLLRKIEDECFNIDVPAMKRKLDKCNVIISSKELQNSLIPPHISFEWKNRLHLLGKSGERLAYAPSSKNLKNGNN